jgi:chitin disaccharide deacetylase
VRLVVNADDLGYDPRIDEGILEAHRRGVVSSASAMVGTRFSARALAEAPPSLGIGLHAVLEPGLDPAAARGELLRQLERFEALRGAPPTHLDSHKHVHAGPGLLAAFVEVAAQRSLPVRSPSAEVRAALRAGGVATPDAFLGDAALRPAWDEARLLAALGSLGPGLTELMAHPGYRPAVARTSFGVEREAELAALTSPRVREAVERLGIRLCSFADCSGGSGGTAGLSLLGGSSAGGEPSGEGP